MSFRVASSVACFGLIVGALGCEVPEVAAPTAPRGGPVAEAPVVSRDPGAPPPVATKPAMPIFAERVAELAGKSACARHEWKGRGRAPGAFVAGISLTFSRSWCRTRGLAAGSGEPGARMARASAGAGEARTDALAHYARQLDRAGLEVDRDGAETLRALYALGLGSGMRESSGKYCEGWDASAGDRRPSDAAEAGAFQTSYDSFGAAPELAQLWDEYRADPSRCRIDEFSRGVKCRAQVFLDNGGSREGVEFQVFTKACPAFATEYAMVLLRTLRTHFGPINRHEAELVPACEELLSDVQRLLEQDPRGACAELG